MQKEDTSKAFSPLILSSVSAGFPSPADDYIDKPLDLNEHLIIHPAATFYCRVSGDSMQGEGIHDGDLLIVDRALPVKHGGIVIANIDGELTCKFFDLHGQRLLSANADYPPMRIPSDANFSIEGVVIHSIRSHVCTR